MILNRISISTLLVCVFFALLTIGAPAWSQTSRQSDRFATEIAAFVQDDANTPSHCPILFVGSSSIRLWRSLDADLAPISTLNRGFGGATIADINTNFDRLVPPSRPWAIFFYAGENDVSEGATPSEVAADFRRFLDLKDAALGATPVYFISLKPSPARSQQRTAQSEVNALVRRLAAAREDLFYVDVASAMLDRDRPRDIFVGDGLHMSERGYAIWTRLIRPLALREARRRGTCNTEPAREAP